MNLESKFYGGWNFIADVILIGVITLISSLFIIPLGASLTAMYDVYLKLINENKKPVSERNKIHVYKDYFNSFKSNFKQSSLSLLVVSILFFILYSYYTIVPEDVIVVRIIIYAATYQFLIITMYIFPIIAKFKGSTFSLIKNALLMGNIYIKTTILMLMSLFGVAVLVIYVHTFFVLLAFSIYGISTAYHINKVFKLHIAEE